MTEKSLDRFTVIDTSIYRPYMEEGVTVDARFTKEIVSGEQLYQRRNHSPRMAANEEWKELDCGWLAGNVAMIVICNDEGTLYEVNPSEEEREETNKKIIEISSEDSELSWFVYPTESFRGSPSDSSLVRIRCQHGEARYTLTVFPK